MTLILHPFYCKYVHIISNQNISIFKNFLSTDDWFVFLSSDDVNLNCEAFMSTLKYYYDLSFPVKKI